MIEDSMDILRFPDIRGDIRSKEDLPRFEYEFLSKLNEDHPQLVEKIVAKIPQWKEWLSKHAGSTDVAEAILRSIDYVSFKEIEDTVQSWVEEVSASLLADPQKKALFLLDGNGSGSQMYFAERVYSLLSPELQSRVVMKGGNDLMNALFLAPTNIDTFSNTDYWRFDDSTNSGRQINSLVLPEFKDFSIDFKRAMESAGRMEEYGRFLSNDQLIKPVLHLCFIRSTKFASQKIKEEWNRFQTLHGQEVDRALLFEVRDYGSFPTVTDILPGLELPGDENTRPAYLYAQNHLVGHPILGFFATKIQDNLPGALCRNAFTPDGLDPLLEKSDITPPWKSHR
jgi:hypothetical protein